MGIDELWQRPYKLWILRGGLSSHQREIGLSLGIAPADPSLLNLIYEGRVRKSFPARTVTIPEIQEVACKVEEAIDGKLQPDS